MYVRWPGAVKRSPEEARLFYYEFTSTALWPVLFSLLDRARFTGESWAALPAGQRGLRRGDVRGGRPGRAGMGERLPPHAPGGPSPRRPAEGREAGPLVGFRVSWLDFKLGLRMLLRFSGLTLVATLAIGFVIMLGAGTYDFFEKRVKQITMGLAGGALLLIVLGAWFTRQVSVSPSTTHAVMFVA